MIVVTLIMLLYKLIKHQRKTSELITLKQKDVEMNDDETFSEGKFDEVVGKIQEKTGKAKEDIKKEIASW